MFDFTGFQEGAMAFLLAFVVAGLFTIAFKYIYQWVTPYNEKALIRAGNVTAAIALAGALIGYALPLASALSHTVSLAGVRRLGDPGRRRPDRRLHHRAHGRPARRPGRASRTARLPSASIWQASRSRSAC
jgi:hypothetical protein